MRRALLSWTLVFALLGAGFAASVLALNGELFSAHGFVRSYLETLARHDADEALAFDGVVAPGDANNDLLSDVALGDIGDIRLLSDVPTGDSHVVRFEVQLAGKPLVSQFTVERTGTRLGLFPEWRFAISPTATLAAHADHDTRISVNGVETTSGPHAVLVPGVFELDHESKYLSAEPVVVSVAEPGASTDAQVQVVQKDALAVDAAAAVAAFLDGCAAQGILNPTGCPFGTKVANRLDGAPAWSMVDYPSVTLTPASTPGEWSAHAPATAHITARVRSLFDGTVSTLNDDIEFTGTYIVTVEPDDTLSVTSPA